MTNRDVFQVSWQGGGGWGDPLERDIAAVAKDVATGAVSPEAARNIYGVALKAGRADAKASDALRNRLRLKRVGKFARTPARFTKAAPFAALSESLLLARDARGTHVVTKAGYILSTNSTRWRAGAVAVTMTKLPAEYRIALHANLAMTAYYCPASGTLLTVDVHRRGTKPPDDVVLDLGSVERLFGPARRERVKEAAE
jgi:N-methylhydantoinase B